jgi:fructose-specific phosphotransferase system IIC component
MATNCLFCFSLFNVLVAVLTFSTDNWLKRHPTAAFIIELSITSVISGVLVGGVFAGCSYSTEPFFAYWCTPQGFDNLNYTTMVPLQITIVAGVVMMLLIFRRLRQVGGNFIP